MWLDFYPFKNEYSRTWYTSAFWLYRSVRLIQQKRQNMSDVYEKNQNKKAVCLFENCVKSFGYVHEKSKRQQ